MDSVQLSLSPRAYLAVDRASKGLGLVLLVLAISGRAGSLSLPVGVLGLAVGTATVFLDGPVEDTASAVGPPTDGDAKRADRPDSRGYLARFHNPKIALVATVGSAIWLLSFLLAGVGVALRGTRDALAVTLFGLSGPLGLLGLGLLVVAALWLAGRILGRSR